MVARASSLTDLSGSFSFFKISSSIRSASIMLVVAEAVLESADLLLLSASLALEKYEQGAAVVALALVQVISAAPEEDEVLEPEDSPNPVVMNLECGS